MPLIRFNLEINDKELEVFLKRLFDEGKSYISQTQFIKRFWSAYTYDNVFENDDVETGDSSNKAGGGLGSVKIDSLSEKVKRCKMF